MTTRKVDFRFAGGDAERRATPNGMRVARRRDQRFRRYAAVVEAVAAHLVALDQHDLAAELCGTGCYRETARARADDAKVGANDFAHGAVSAFALRGANAR